MNRSNVIQFPTRETTPNPARDSAIFQLIYADDETVAAVLALLRERAAADREARASNP